MADEPIVAPAAAAPADGVQAAAPAAPQAPVAAEPAPPAPPEPSPAAPAEPAAPPEPAAPAIPEAEPGLLEQHLAEEAAKKDGEKPSDPPKPGEPEAPKPGDASAIAFEPYTLPEGFKADEPAISEFNALIAKADLTPQQRGQALVDLHVKQLESAAKTWVEQQWEMFHQTRKEWANKFKSDPELGGPNFANTMRKVAIARDMFVAEKDKAEFDTFLKTTGASDNPAFLRFLHNVGAKWQEPAPLPASDGYRPPKDIGQKPKGQGGLRESLYTHPNSVARRGT